MTLTLTKQHVGERKLRQKLQFLLQWILNFSECRCDDSFFNELGLFLQIALHELELSNEFFQHPIQWDSQNLQMALLVGCTWLSCLCHRLTTTKDEQTSPNQSTTSNKVLVQCRVRPNVQLTASKNEKLC